MCEDTAFKLQLDDSFAIITITAAAIHRLSVVGVIPLLSIDGSKYMSHYC